MPHAPPAGALALLLLLGCAPAAPRPAVRGAVVVRLATWNVHDLFDAADRITPPGALDEVLPADEVEARLDAVAAVLRRLGADAVLLQEVEDAGLAARLAARAGYPWAHLLEGNDPRGIDLALLSCLPVEAYRGHAADVGPDGRPLWPRDAVEAVLDAGGRRLVVVGTHLSSRLSDPEGRRRTVQAAALRALADAAAARWGASLVVAGGDLNDGAGAPALAPLFADGAWVDAAAALGGEAWTWSDGSSRAVLDHLVVRHADVGLLLEAGAVAGADVSAASDHRPVLLDLLLP